MNKLFFWWRKKRTQHSTLSAPSSGFNSEDGSLTEEHLSSHLKAEARACPSGNTYSYSYCELQQCFSDYLGLMKRTITLKGSFQWENVQLTNVLLCAGSLPVMCKPSDGRAVYFPNASAPYGQSHQIWSTLSLVLYDFGQGQYGLLALNLGPNYALKIVKDSSDQKTTSLAVKFEQVFDRDEIMRFQMTGRFDRLQLSATVDNVTYHLYAVTAPQESCGSLTAVSDADERGDDGTIDFTFKRPIHMYSPCQETIAYVPLVPPSD